MAGKSPSTIPVPTPYPTKPGNFDYCEQPSVERGSGQGPEGGGNPEGSRIREEFMEQMHSRADQVDPAAIAAISLASAIELHTIYYKNKKVALVSKGQK